MTFYLLEEKCNALVRVEESVTWRFCPLKYTKDVQTELKRKQENQISSKKNNTWEKTNHNPELVVVNVDRLATTCAANTWEK